MGERLYTIVQMGAFTRQWERLGLGDDDLRSLEAQLLAGPQAAPVVPRAGGVRKARFAPPSWRRGRRGATRVLYLFMEIGGVIFLFSIYAKTEQENATVEQLKVIRDLAEEIKRAME